MFYEPTKRRRGLNKDKTFFQEAQKTIELEQERDSDTEPE